MVENKKIKCPDDHDKFYLVWKLMEEKIDMGSLPDPRCPICDEKLKNPEDS